VELAQRKQAIGNLPEKSLQKVLKTVDARVRMDLLTIGMKDRSTFQQTLSGVERSIQIISAKITEWENARTKLEDGAVRLRSILNDLSPELGAPKPDPVAPAPTVPVVNVPDETAANVVPKRRIKKCCVCEEYYLVPGRRHDCGPDGQYSDGNCFGADQLDEVFGEGGWKAEEPDAIPAKQVRMPGPLFRPDSQKHRVWVETKLLLEEKRNAHVKKILEHIENTIPEVFNDVKDKSSRLSNILSQLKSMGLLHCDTRGNWSLRRP
jgi:hypothetical protein